MSEHFITRKIEIDAGHRIPDHKSKCKNFHGHRYVIEATCSGKLHIEGEEQGMVMDFGFLKEEMVKEIDQPCDHGMILYYKDPIVENIMQTKARYDTLMHSMKELNYWSDITMLGKTYFILGSPTAEHLAAHWFIRLNSSIANRTAGWAILVKVRVYETPNCFAEVTRESLG